MSKGDDQASMFEILTNFRRVVNKNLPKAAVSSAAAKLNFTDASISEAMSKRKSSDDSINTPPKRWRTDSECSQGTSPCVASPWEARRLKTELIEAKGQVATLESRINHQHLIRKEMEMLFENEKKSLIEERSSKERAVQDLEDRLKIGRGREAELRTQLTETVKNLDELNTDKDREKQMMQKEISNLTDRLVETTGRAEEQVAEMKKEVEDLSQELEASQREADTLKAAHEKATALAQQASGLQLNLETQGAALAAAELQVRQLQAEQKDYQEWLEHAKTSQKRLADLPNVERENVRLRNETRDLRAAVQQKLLMEEQLHCLTTTLASMQPLNQQLKDLKASYVQLEREVEEWRSAGQRHEVAEPGALAARLDALQQRDLNLTTEKLNSDTVLTKMKNDLLSAKHEYEKANTRLTDVQYIQRNQQSLIHRLQKKLLLVSRDRDSYRQQLDSYERELTITLAGEGSSGAGGLLAARVEGLEKALQGYRDLVAKMEDDMAASKADCTPALQEQLSRLRDEVGFLKKDNEILRTRKDHLEVQLEQQALASAQEPPKTKMLHLTENPLVKAENDVKIDLEKALSEIAELKKKIKKLEANEMEMTQRLSETIRDGDTPAAEINALKAQIEAGKKKMERLKEVATSSSQEYRHVCYTLMGYKIDRTSVNNYRISSMYADSPDEYLNFKLCDGGIEMVETEYSSTIETLVDLHLHHQKSIPVFLSALTLNLFQKITFLSDTIAE